MSVNLGDRRLPTDHYWKFDPRVPEKWEYLWKDLLKTQRAHIYMFQEMMVESYYCRSEKIDAPNQHFCSGREPRTNYMERALRLAFGANWRDHWDYVCKAYECIVVNTDMVQFVDKNDPFLTRYVSFRWENGQVVIGDENDEDSGILLTSVWIKGKDGTWRKTILTNDHLRTPADPFHGADLRQAALEYQNSIMYQGQGGYPYSLDRRGGVLPQGVGFLESLPVIKCGDMNIDHNTSIYDANDDTLALITSLAFACPPDAQTQDEYRMMSSPYMLVGSERYTSVAGGGMFDVCATTGEYTGTSNLASRSGTSWDGVGVDHNAVGSVLNHYEDSDTVDITIKLCPELRDKAGLSRGGTVNVPTCASANEPDTYVILDGPLNLPVQLDEDGNLHLQVPKALYEKGFLLDKLGSGPTDSGLLETEFKCSAATGKCCKNDYSPSQPYQPIVPGQTEYEICN
ncbi:hypothetical protein HNQ05_000455 [Oceanithermus desulfurans]|uniref:Uncharacterized protein n=1 Tax=Oceanithermus desulfurans TaxID=227924 RepID=A0ABR6NZC8_9DEIN|nr:hypothetical protein [Oceanithermus desulfurans]